MATQVVSFGNNRRRLPWAGQLHFFRKLRCHLPFHVGGHLMLMVQRSESVDSVIVFDASRATSRSFNPLWIDV
jgi:hypothetical protein